MIAKNTKIQVRAEVPDIIWSEHVLYIYRDRCGKRRINVALLLYLNYS